MNRFGKLFNFELNRFIKIYVVLIGITILSQLVGVIVTSKNYLGLVQEMIQKEGMAKADFFEMYGVFSMRNLTHSLWFIGPIILAMAALIFYMFLIWYRDWFGKNTFIYRLLMLPTTRLNVYLAKATAIMTMVIGLVSVQLILLPVEIKLIKSMVPSDYRFDLSVTEVIRGFDMLGILMPQSFIEFILYYGMGFMAMVVLFTIILFERSFRIKGILIGIAYGALTVLIFLAPVLLQEYFGGRLFHSVEVLILEIIMGILVIAASIMVSRFLLKNKVTV